MGVDEKLVSLTRPVNGLILYKIILPFNWISCELSNFIFYCGVDACIFWRLRLKYSTTVWNKQETLNNMNKFWSLQSCQWVLSSGTHRPWVNVFIQICDLCICAGVKLQCLLSRNGRMLESKILLRNWKQWGFYTHRQTKKCTLKQILGKSR